MVDNAWIATALMAARPQALSALLRYFRNLDRAEEAFQEASLRAIRTWPLKGPPRDTVAWLVFVGRNSGIDAIRKTARNVALPPEERLSDRDDAEAGMVERLDGEHYRDDILRLLFICCHPDLPANQQIALALRIVAGVPLRGIARAFLVSETAMEQRITRAKARIAANPVSFDPPDAHARLERLGTVAVMLYLVFNEGYSRGHSDPNAARLCDEAIRLTRLLLRLFPTEPEIMGLLALMLLQHARHHARRDAQGQLVLLDDQDRRLWTPAMLAEGRALVEKALRHQQPGTYQVQAAIAAQHARAATAEDTDWQAIDRLYQTLELIQPSPVVTLNRAVAVSKWRDPAAALKLLVPLAETLDGYFYFHGMRGGLLAQIGQQEAARLAFNRAIALANSPAEAAHIRQHLDRLAMMPPMALPPMIGHSGN
ncbi:MAG: RNA polymerase sigma factor [Candidatus Devosia phytovorans]|uniref:RNA polymerase sigma factor n=1 Tax=Candidatus Devosia phytovorans TaxID=3121372 RepID=A0AAJ5VT98_9HYPH|nr:RNA polymerase sigma factor [Devosia sp.]WEK04394.1 MAG: RNA polymerase sigma factor [Devosia sp.]